MEERIARTLEDLEAIAAEVVENLPDTSAAQLIALHGDLGAGKTAFTQAIARLLGVQERVVSPTFMIMRSYQTSDERFRKLVHIDAYRVEDVSEMNVLRIPELFKEKDTLIVIEWPENVPALITPGALRISITIEAHNARRITFKNGN